MHIAEKINNNRFRLAGGEPGTEVSWQVTGIRQDAYANKNRIKVEVEKSENDRGKYLHPNAFGLPETVNINYESTQKHKEKEQRLEKERVEMKQDVQKMDQEIQQRELERQRMDQEMEQARQKDEVFEKEREKIDAKRQNQIIK